MLLLGLFLWLSTAIHHSLSAQRMERFSNAEGFNQNTINAIAQDSHGFIWFGTSNGLIKYDGYEFTSFTSESSNESSISNNLIKKLFTDSAGILWIGTIEGMEVYVPSLEKFYRVPLPHNLSISHITADALGNIWFSGQNELYSCKLMDMAAGSFEVSENLWQAPSESTLLNAFFFIDETSLLVGSTEGLYYTDVERSSQGQSPKIGRLIAIPAFSEHNITTLKKTQQAYWIGTTSGLFKATLEGNSLHIVRNFESVSNKLNTKNKPEIKAIFEDKTGSLWIGTTTEGLSKYLPETESFLNYPFDPKNKWGVSSTQVNVIFQDNFDVLWIGTAQGGVNKLDLSQKPFFNYGHNPYEELSIRDNLINAILEDQQGRLWVAGYDGSLSRSMEKIQETSIHSLQFENLQEKIELEEKDMIRSIFEDDKGFIWFGTDLSLIVYNPLDNTFKKIKLRTEEQIVRRQQYRSIVQIDPEKIILGGYQIIVLKDPWKNIQEESSPEIDVHSTLYLGSKGVQAFLMDTQGKLWFGTQVGLFELIMDDESRQLAARETTIKGERLKLSNPMIFSLYEDSQRNIWIGTFGGGLNKMSLDPAGKPQAIEYFRKNNVLPDDAIYGILPEGEEKVWISTDMGLVRFHLEKHSIDVFDVRDGLPQNNFRQGAYGKGKSGYYYFGGLNGLTAFKPEGIKLNTQPPEILITDLLINNQTISIGEKLNNSIILKKSIAETESIAIKHKQRIIAFNVAVKHTSLPLKNRVAYKLEGFNDEWIEENDGKTTITYTNLPVGTYTFMVKGANGDGTWSTTTRSLNLEILPPWYQTWWSYLLFALLFIGISVGVVVYFTQNEKLKQQLKYEEIDKERLKTINQGKFRYFTNLSHEFRTPLTLIAGPLEYVINHNSNADNHKYLAIIQKNTKRLLSLVDQLITFRKAEQGHESLNWSKNTLGGFIYPIAEAFEGYAVEKNINFYFKINAPDEEIIIDVEKLERIIFNLLSNAFKYTPAFGSISIESEVRMSAEQKMIHIDVIDTGKGIPPEDLDNIFERFYQLGNKTGSISGGGIGLAFCKTMVNLLGGEIFAASKPGEETRFSVILPSKAIGENEADVADFAKKSFIKDWIPLPAKLIKEGWDASTDNSEEKHTLLIVENEVDVQTFLKGTLSKKYNITIANNGVEALEKIEQQEPDVVVSDVMMPEMDGFQLCEKIKSDSKWCHISVLLLTALGQNEDMIKGLEFGADEYISKPFSLKNLELRIEKLIQNKLRLKEHFSTNSNLPKKDIGISTRDKEFLSNTIDIIEKNIANSNFGVQEMASAMGMSTAHLYRRLKQLTGQTPNAYLRNFRLQRAADLLRQNEGYNVTEVMYQIGIESNSYFSTAFKKLHGISPSEFLRNDANRRVN